MFSIEAESSEGISTALLFADVLKTLTLESPILSSSTGGVTAFLFREVLL